MSSWSSFIVRDREKFEALHLDVLVGFWWGKRIS